MYLYIEIWKARAAWLKLTTAERQAKINQLLQLAQQHPIEGVIPFSFHNVGNVTLFDGITERPVIISDQAARPTGFHYAAAWMVPTRELIKQFESRVMSLGWWFDYFEQKNAWGVMNREATVADMIGAGQAPSTDPFAGKKAGDTYGDYAWCPPGAFKMGNPPVDVIISQGFWMGKYLVTQELYTSVMQENPSAFVGSKLPVESVNRSQVTGFCDKLTRRERDNGRLPADWEYSLATEAQWEYAARAGTNTAYPWGDDPNQADEYSWHINNSGYTTHAVGTKKPNAWGLYDVLGNALEWCMDAWVDTYPGGKDPKVTEKDLHPRPDQSRTPFWVCRGGGWFIPPQVTPQVRVRLGSGDQGYLLGFRVAIVKKDIQPFNTNPSSPAKPLVNS